MNAVPERIPDVEIGPPIVIGDYEIPTILLDRAPYWPVVAVGQALEYSKAGADLLKSLRRWAGDGLLDPEDLVRLEGAALAAWKRGMSQAGFSEENTKSVSSLMLMSWPAVNVLRIRSNKPAAIEFQRKITREVLPQLDHDGEYRRNRKVLPTGQVVERAPTPADGDNREARLMAREQRLMRKLELDEKKLDLERVRLIDDQLSKLPPETDPQFVAAYRVALLENGLEGPPATKLLTTKTERHYSATECAKAAAVSTARWGRARKAIGIIGNRPGLCRLVEVKRAGAGNAGSAEATQYLVAGFREVCAELERQGHLSAGGVEAAVARLVSS